MREGDGCVEEVMKVLDRIVCLFGTIMTMNGILVFVEEEDGLFGSI